MNILQSLILGIVEGVTEFLPISSTGHLILTSNLLKIADSDFLKSFEVIIQLGAILAVLVLYWRVFLIKENLKKIIVGFIPTGIIGLIFYKIVKTYLMGSETVVLLALLIGGIALIIFELIHKEKEIDFDDSGTLKISYKQSFIVGIFQSIAIIPGVSRSAATILGGLSLGLKRKTIVEFSFLLAVPTMLGATGLDLLKNFNSFQANQIGLIFIGFTTSFIVALLSIKLLLKYIQNHSFISFGIYRIAISIIFWVFIL